MLILLLNPLIPLILAKENFLFICMKHMDFVLSFREWGNVYEAVEISVEANETAIKYNNITEQTCIITTASTLKKTAD